MWLNDWIRLQLHKFRLLIRTPVHNPVRKCLALHTNQDNVCHFAFLVKGVSFKSFDYGRHRACTIARNSSTLI